MLEIYFNRQLSQIPFLSTGSDTGRREVIHEGHSEFSGDYVVEDVEVPKSSKFVYA
jgi:hypothetical protein